MDRRALLAGGVAAAAFASPVFSAPADPFPGILDAFLALSPEQATTAGLDTGARSPLKHRLDARDTAHRLRFYDALINARPALQRARSDASGRSARVLDSALWVSDIFAGIQTFPYASVDGYYYPVPFAVTQMSGAYKDVPDFLDVQHSVTSRDDAEAYLDRLADFAKVVEGETALCREQAARGAAPPSFILDRTIAQLQRFQAAQSGATPGLVASLVRRTTAAGIAGDWEARARSLVAGPLAAAIAGQPLDEMVGFVGQGAHVAGADVQEVASAARRVGDAQRRLAPTLDHGNAKAAPADDLGGQQHAAGAAADDGDVGGGVRKMTHAATMEAPCRQGQPAPPPRRFRRPGSR